MPRPCRKKWHKADDNEERRLEALPPKQRKMSVHPVQEVPGIMVTFHILERVQSNPSAGERIRPVSLAYRKTGMKDSAKFDCYRRTKIISSEGIKSNIPSVDYPEEIWFKSEQLELAHMNESVRSIRTSLDRLIAKRHVREDISLPGQTQVFLHPRMLPANENDKEDALEPKDPATAIDPSKSHNLYETSLIFSPFGTVADMNRILPSTTDESELSSVASGESDHESEL